MIVSLVVATTTDGFIGRESNDRSFDWTSAEDTRFYINSIKKADVIVMGSKTFAGIKRHPKNSHYVIYSRTMEGFVNPRPEVITVEITNLEPGKLLEKLKSEGYKNVVIAGGSNIYKMFIQANVLDALYVVKEPVIFEEGILLFKDVAFDEATKLFELVLEKKLNEEGTVLQKWKRKDKK